MNRSKKMSIIIPCIVMLCAVCVFSKSQTVVVQPDPKRTSADAAAKPGSWFTSKQVADKVWRIDDRGSDNMYLVAGKDKALLIDTGLGVGDLAGFVKTLTALPVTVVNTHGHPDHAGGNRQFRQVFAHPDDFEMTKRFSGGEYRAATVQRAVRENPELVSLVLKDTAGLADPKLLPAAGGMIFDLGGRKLEVIETPGHTRGSICLLDAGNRLLFTGDNDNTLVWLFLKDCLPLEVYLRTLKKVEARNGTFDTLLPGHGDPIDKSFIAEQIVCVEQILSGACKGEPYQSFAGDAKLCSYKRAGVAFNPENLHSK
jgi:hydroxyacylglutathione hydrolase